MPVVTPIARLKRVHSRAVTITNIGQQRRPSKIPTIASAGGAMNQDKDHRSTTRVSIVSATQRCQARFVFGHTSKTIDKTTNHSDANAFDSGDPDLSRTETRVAPANIQAKTITMRNIREADCGSNCARLASAGAAFARPLFMAASDRSATASSLTMTAPQKFHAELRAILLNPSARQ
jgi:hypothetical protein